jgi:hypothetical protein
MPGDLDYIGEYKERQCDDNYLNEYKDFCGKRCPKLHKSVNGESKLSIYIRERCNALFHLNPKLHWPGDKPIALTRNRLSSLKNSRYFVAPKSDGERSWLVFGTSANYQDHFIGAVNSKYDVHLVQFKAARCLFRWTVLDGEIVQEKGKYYFLVFDCLCFQGMNLTSFHFRDRLQLANAVCKLVETIEASPFEIIVKEFQELGKLDFTKFEKSPFKTDGAILVKDHAPITPFASTTTLKLKPKHKATGDFYLGITPEKTVELVVIGDTNQGAPTSLLYALQDPEMMNKKCKKQNKAKGVFAYSLDDYCAACNEIIPVVASMSQTVVECIYCPNDKIWKVCRIRGDKMYPNKYITVQEAQTSVFENITLEECNQIVEPNLPPCCSRPSINSLDKIKLLGDHWGLYRHTE